LRSEEDQKRSEEDQKRSEEDQKRSEERKIVSVLSSLLLSVINLKIICDNVT